MDVRIMTIILLVFMPDNQLVNSKVYSRCDLAKKLFFRHKFMRSQIPNILCLVHHSSNYNTSAISAGEGSEFKSHGLFQINDKTWCSNHPDAANECKIDCEKLRDDKIEDDMRCMRKIYAKKGLKDWPVWTKFCKGKYLMHYLQACYL